MRRLDICSSLFWLLFAIYIIMESYRITIGNWQLPGPGYFSFGAALILGAMSLLVLVKTLLRTPEKEILAMSTEEEHPRRQNVAFVLGGMIFFTLFLNWIGFVLCTFFLLLFFVRVVSKERWSYALVVALSATMGSYLLFEVFLKAGLPRGFLGF